MLQEGKTALILAAQKGHHGTAALLVKAGAKLDAKDKVVDASVWCKV